MTSPEVRWYFGSFTVRETQRVVERDGQAVRLGPRAFDLLLQLIKHAGECLSNAHLLATVWAGVVVEEASVRVHVSILRKALGEPDPLDDFKEWITNIPLRGYRFNGRVHHEVLDDAPPPLQQRQDSRPPAVTRPPAGLTRLVGRAADVKRALATLDTHRLVTVAGTGGIGKTCLAIHAAECHQLAYGVQVAFADLSALGPQDEVLGTIARALGVVAGAGDAAEVTRAIAREFAWRDVLLLIDNCEHVLPSLLLPVGGLLAAVPGLRVLATSREALGLAGEYVLRLSPLDVPPSEALGFDEAMNWPAVRLLVECGTAAGAAAFKPSQSPLFARIARQLDGIPLAIELAGARLGVQPVDDLAGRLGDLVHLSAIGNRNGRERHRSLAAALDWSVALLEESELDVFRRLSVFTGRFSVGLALGANPDMSAQAAQDALISLASKSLVCFDGNDAAAPYHLLGTTRSYAAGLLRDHAAATSAKSAKSATGLGIRTQPCAREPRRSHEFSLCIGSMTSLPRSERAWTAS